MSRKLVLVSVFLIVLPAMAVALRAQSADLPQKAGGTPTPQMPVVADADPFGDGAAKPDQTKPPGELKADPAKPKASGWIDVFGESAPDEPKPDRAKPKADRAEPAGGQSAHAKLQGGEKAILKAMKEETSIEFVDMPLKDVLDHLSEKHRIPIHTDSAALKEAGVEESTPVTCNLSGIPLRSALEIILDELQLKWTIHYDVLLITSPTKAESGDFLLTRSYDVTDLVTNMRDHEERDPLSPTKEPAANAWYNVPMTGMGDRRFTAGAYQPTSAQPIMDTITNTIATKSWADNGGSGTIEYLDRMLVITQTLESHLEVEQFLADLRARRQARPTLSVEIHWLWLNAKQCDHLLAGQAKPFEKQRSLAVDPERLRQIAREVPGFYGHVVCLDGTGTVISAGDRRAIITGAIPVVGGLNPPVAYQPVIGVPNVGVTAQLRPTFVPGTKTVTLDIASIITRWDASRKPAIIGTAWSPEDPVVGWNPPLPPSRNTGNAAATPQPVAPMAGTHTTQGGSASCPVDQPVMPTQQIGTTLTVPLGEPVIVGAMTFAAAEDAGLSAAQADPVQVYLIATTSIVREAGK